MQESFSFSLKIHTFKINVILEMINVCKTSKSKANKKKMFSES